MKWAAGAPRSFDPPRLGKPAPVAYVEAMPIHEASMIDVVLRRGALAAAVAALLCAPAAAQQNLDKVSFGTNWVAEAEQGGHYQAVADGTYR